MEVRITFRSEIFLDGKDMKEIVEKWENIRLFSGEAVAEGADFIEVDTVEDADTYDDMMDEFNNPYGDEDEDDEEDEPHNSWDTDDTDEIFNDDKEDEQ